ncbi:MULTISPECIES: hypothetical protein [Moorena]|uniref:Uncharacterized protein n=1 Tax=Moorena producens 3L TaxID=489825 RepID=F4XT84_9CYAN|nr:MULTISPECIES: hypothetical protein [Moorena]NEQ16529.1 hypothetical protein [Moorena sp. SIO3E2]NES81559.1 hypothetical protein [Moorena sp. SIO2B7]EGJ32259.1 hypothetical protein LYNGBM3L_27210 [Moorena producens 3L]NEP64486.1 hypothetical protein [Moorena sp. SIO3A5]NEQ06763.1 hypothetical protein [Moorena sp. SIO4E2]
MTTVSKSEKLKEIQEAYKKSNNSMAYELCRVFEQVWQVAPDESALAIANKIMSKDISYFMFVFDLDTEEDYSEKLKQASKESYGSRREWRQKLEDLEGKKQLEAEEEEVKENLLNLLSDSSADTDSKIRENLLEIVKACL